VCYGAAFNDLCLFPSDIMSASIGDNGSLFSDKKELAMIDLLLQCGQKHLFDAWPAKGTKDQQKQA